MNNKKYTWNLSDLYKSDDDPQIEIDVKKTQEKVDEFIKKWKPRKDYFKDPKVLAEAFSDFESLYQGNSYVMAKPLLYFFLRNAQDETDTEIKARMQTYDDIVTKIANDLEFFVQNISKKVSKGNQEKFLNTEELKVYRHLLDSGFKNAKYLLSEKEEKVLKLLAKTSFYNWKNMVSSIISKFKAKWDGKNLSYEDVFDLTSNPSQEKRDWANKQINNYSKKIIDIAEYEMNSIVQTSNTIKDLKDFPTYDFSQHLGDDIDTEVVRTMTETVSNSFNVSQRYYKLYSQLFGKETIEYHERNVELFTNEKEYSFEFAQSIVKEEFKKLDPDFFEIAKEIIDNSQIDAFPRAKKTSGGYCMGLGKNLPIYILMNYQKKFTDIRTLAHELGHAIHHKLSTKNQIPLNTGLSLATAEVASTFFEDFAFKRIIAEATTEERFFFIQKRIGDSINTIFRQVACYNFELELHESVEKKSFLSKEEIGKLFKKNMLAALGSTVHMSKLHQNWWAYWPHIRSPFYVYSYASGLLISKALQKRVKENPKFISNVKGFLSSGTSKSTKDIFLDLGIDITKKEFWEKGIEEISSMIDEWEALGKELGKFK